MQREPVALATSILRNSVALMAVGFLAKGMGLVLAVLIARFLGPSSMGMFAVLFSIALLVEYVAPLGLPDVLIREVAARPGERVRLWKQAARLAFAASLVPAATFLVAAWLYREDASIRGSLLALAPGIPCATMALVAQSVLQGMEKMLYITWTTFLTRVASLVALVLMLLQGMGVESAFISRVLFQASTAAIFAWLILRDAPGTADTGRPGIALARTLPFAVNRVLTESTTRAPLLLMPILFTLADIGIFDAADRIRMTLGIMVAVATTAIMPALSRSFADRSDDRHALVSFGVKYVCVILSVAALAISIFADVIVRLLYGPEFAPSALLLQVLIWTQVLVATDFVMKQAMIANGREYAVVGRALAGLACLTALVLGLGRFFGLVGAAAGVLTSAAFTLWLDARYLARESMLHEAARFLGRPLACAFLAGGVLLALDGANPFARLAAGIGAYALAAAALRLVPRAEQAFLNDALRHGLGRRSAG
jgi:O-antigen/teichoic acid export membrane protein